MPFSHRIVSSAMITVLLVVAYRTMSGRRDVKAISHGNLSCWSTSTLMLHSAPGVRTDHSFWQVFCIPAPCLRRESAIGMLVGWSCSLKLCVPLKPRPVSAGPGHVAIRTGPASRLPCNLIGCAAGWGSEHHRDETTHLHAIPEVYVSGTWEAVICGPNEEAQPGLEELPHVGPCYDPIGPASQFVHLPCCCWLTALIL